jgi:cellulose synthase operon protein YhjQ
MTTLALASLAGGVGRSTLTAQLATLAARDGRFSLALEWDPQNLLALHFGASRGPQAGIGAQAQQGQGWAEAALRSADGVAVLPFGRLADDALCAWQSRMQAEPEWLAAQLARLQRPAGGWTFIDTPRAPCSLLRSAVRAADAVLLVVHADPATLAALDSLLALAAGRPHAVVVNAFDAARTLQSDLHAVLLERLRERVVPYAVHRDEAVPEAMARQAALVDVAPHAQATHDLIALWRWLQARYGEAAHAGPEPSRHAHAD